MQLGKNQKIAGFGLAALVIVGLVHFMIFAQKTKAIKGAEADYQAKAGSLQNMKRPKGMTELSRYQETTSEQYRRPFAKIVDKFNIVSPKEVEAWYVDQDNPQLTAELYDLLLGTIDDLLDRKAQGDSGQGVRCSFLGTGWNTWNIPTGLPQSVQSGQSNLFDLLENVAGNYDTIRAAQAGTQFRTQKVFDYQNALFLLGINFNGSIANFPQVANTIGCSYYDLYQLGGPGAFFLKILQHARLYYNAQGDVKEYDSIHEILQILGFNDTTGEQEAVLLKDILYEDQNTPLALGTTIIDISKAGAGNQVFFEEVIYEYDLRQFFYYYLPQIQGVIDIIDLASAAQATDIEYVRLREAVEVPKVKEPAEEGEGEAEEEVVEDPMAGGMGEMPEGMDPMEWEMMMMYGMGDPSMMSGRGAGGVGGGAAGTETEDAVAVAAPIDMIIVGDNASISQILYDISHTHKPFEIDSLRIASQVDPNTQAVLLRATISINVITFLNDIDLNALKDE